MVAASGAIAGILAGYVALHPKAPILAVFPVFIFLHFVRWPAYVFVFIWFGFQLLMGLTTLGYQGGDTAFFAHVGGFIVGLGLVYVVKPSSGSYLTV